MNLGMLGNYNKPHQRDNLKRKGPECMFSLTRVSLDKLVQVRFSN
jgi:hypothetical protein